MHTLMVHQFSRILENQFSKFNGPSIPPPSRENHQFSRIQRQSAYYFSHTQPLQRGGAASARGLNRLKRWRSKRQPTLWRSKRRQTLWSYKRLPTLWRFKRQLSRGAWSASSGGAPHSPSPHQGRRFLSHFSAAVSPGSVRDMA